MKAASKRFSWISVTQLGRWSIWLAVAFVLMFLVNVPINLYIMRPEIGPQMAQPLYAAYVIFMLIAGLAGGVLGLIAVTKRQERSPLVWGSILCGLFVFLLILNEVLQGIQYMMGA